MLLKRGFFIHHQKGSHVTLRHESDPRLRVTVPAHKGKPLGKGLLVSILKDAGITLDELRNSL